KKANTLDDSRRNSRRVDTRVIAIDLFGKHHSEHHEERSALADQRVRAQPCRLVLQFALETKSCPCNEGKANAEQGVPLAHACGTAPGTVKSSVRLTSS